MVGVTVYSALSYTINNLLEWLSDFRQLVTVGSTVLSRTTEIIKPNELG